MSCPSVIISQSSAPHWLPHWPPSALVGSADLSKSRTRKPSGTSVVKLPILFSPSSPPLEEAAPHTVGSSNTGVFFFFSCSSSSSSFFFLRGSAASSLRARVMMVPTTRSNVAWRSLMSSFDRLPEFSHLSVSPARSRTRPRSPPMSRPDSATSRQNRAYKWSMVHVIRSTSSCLSSVPEVARPPRQSPSGEPSAVGKDAVMERMVVIRPCLTPNLPAVAMSGEARPSVVHGAWGMHSKDGYWQQQ
mmetsp:Transcript_3264/g.6619  ORF Transcript_3264/g.6619 Transcript_3264/m.6619 type:complete len:246 (+) Transcript_3264:732-1469(+)